MYFFYLFFSCSPAEPDKALLCKLYINLSPPYRSIVYRRESISLLLYLIADNETEDRQQSVREGLPGLVASHRV